MPNFQVLDAYGSVITIESSVVGGANRQVISATTGNSSVVLLGGTNPIGSVAVLQGTNPWNISSVYGNVSGSVVAFQGGAWIPSVSGTVDIGTIPGSVITFQGTDPWRISSVYGNVSGSVLSQQLGTRISSVVNSIPSSLVAGVYAHRNDAVSSFLGGNLSWNPLATDSAGRVLAKPFAAEESRIEGYISLTSTSVTNLVAAAGAGLRNYITDLWVANTGAAATLVTFSSDGGASILGYTIAPAGSGSNLPGLQTPIRTPANATFSIQPATATSTLYVTVKGFKAP